MRRAPCAVRRALALAEPEGYVHVFVAEGPPMAALLRALTMQGSAPRPRRLLDALGSSQEAARVDQGLIDPLSPRELGVRRLLSTHPDGPDIARQLFVSLNTVRTHAAAASPGPWEREQPRLPRPG